MVQSLMRLMSMAQPATRPALRHPMIENRARAQRHPARVQAARSRVQLVELGVAHPDRHQHAPDEHCNRTMGGGWG